MSTLAKPGVQSEPAWDIARLFPNQGDWSEGEYLDLNGRTNRFVELSDGYIEVLDMPSRTHQQIVLFLCNTLIAFASRDKLGEAVISPYPVRLRKNKFREPDVVFMLTEHAERLHEDYADGADLVIEVLSKDRDRDLQIKRAEYAEAGITEYWIVDPREQRITVLRLAEGGYETHGEFTHAERVSSALLAGFDIGVREVFTAAHT